MKLDMELVKKILLSIEEHPDPFNSFSLQIEGYTDLQIAYHIKLLSEANLIDAVNWSDSGGRDWRAKSLTWKGHEFLSSAKNSTVWEKSKALLKSKGLDFSIETMKYLFKEVTIALIKEGVK